MMEYLNKYDFLFPAKEKIFKQISAILKKNVSLR